MQDVLTVIVSGRAGAVTLSIPFIPDVRMEAAIADVIAQATADAVRSLLRRQAPLDSRPEV